MDCKNKICRFDKNGMGDTMSVMGLVEVSFSSELRMSATMPKRVLVRKGICTSWPIARPESSSCGTL